MDQLAKKITKPDIDRIAAPLLAWYKAHGRADLPWRVDRHLWGTILSEIMLQQTQIVTVLPYYAKFLATWPSPEAMAQSTEQEVLKAWEGLGYYRRARLLYQLAQALAATDLTAVPTEKELNALPGIGFYTAKAILAFNYNLPKLPVDGNLVRVFARLFKVEIDPSKEGERKKLARHIEPLIPEGEGRDFGEALMDLGATICNKLNPLCERCPLEALCRARQDNVLDLYPKTAPRIKLKQQKRRYLVFYDKDAIYLQKRERGLLQNTYEYYPLSIEEVEDKPPATTPLELELLLQEHFTEEERARMAPPRKLLFKTHRFTHRIWHLEFFGIALTAPIPRLEDNFLPRTKLDRYPIATAFSPAAIFKKI